MSTLTLLYPEWQSYGENADVFHGARQVATQLFRGTTFLEVEVPQEEELSEEDGVLGLRSVANRFERTLSCIKEQAPSRILLVGGTCGVEVAPVSYLNEKYQGDLAVVWFDAHGDLNTPQSSPSGHFHGMPARTLLGDGPSQIVSKLPRKLRPGQLFLVGTRDLDEPEACYVQDNNISMTLPEHLGDGSSIVSDIRSRGLTNIYLHLDLDVLNPKSFPDTLMEAPGGPGMEQISTALRSLAENFNVIGFSIVEFCDRSGGGIQKLRELVLASGITIASSRILGASAPRPAIT